MSGVVFLGFGPMGVDMFSKVANVCGDGAVMDTDVARMAGANFACGHPDALAALRDRLEAGALYAERAANPGLSLEAAAWLGGGERGLSSNTIFEHLTGVKTLGEWRPSYPHDTADLRRCRLLLDRVPELVPLFPRMAEVSPVWAALVAGWDRLCATMDAESPNWRAGRGLAPKTYELMKEIIKEAGYA